MSTIELKNKVLQRLKTVKEPYLLEEILGLIEIESKREKILEIPEHYQERLEKSIAQKKAGNTIPNSEVEEGIEKWLYK